MSNPRDEVTAIATFNTKMEAEMAAEVLQNEDIVALLVPLGPGAGVFGQGEMLIHEMRVRVDQADRAREILKGLNMLDE